MDAEMDVFKSLIWTCHNTYSVTLNFIVMRLMKPSIKLDSRVRYVCRKI